MVKERKDPAVEPLDAAAAEEKKRADFLPGREPEGEDVPFCEDAQPVVVRTRGTIGQTVYEPGAVLGEVRLATGVTINQFCAAIAHRKAGPKSE